jgi:hypothetical protein
MVTVNDILNSLATLKAKIVNALGAGPVDLQPIEDSVQDLINLFSQDLRPVTVESNPDN